MSVLPECIYTTYVQCHQRPEEGVKTTVIGTGVNSRCVPLLGAGTNADPLQVSGFNYQPPLAHHGLRSYLTLCSEYRIIDTSGILGTFIGQSGYLLSCGMARGTLALQPRWRHKSSSQETRGRPSRRIMPGSLVLSTKLQPRRKQLLRGSRCESTVLHLSLRWPATVSVFC